MRSPIIHQTSDRPSYIRVNLRLSAVKKERSPFLIIQKGDRPFYNPHSADILSDLILKKFRIVKTSND
ncbi:hypothetical protein QUB47_28365, partial [Microcoleus sp. AT9_B5]